MSDLPNIPVPSTKLATVIAVGYHPSALEGRRDCLAGV